MSSTQTDHERRVRRGLFQDGLWQGCQASRLHLALIVSLTGAIGFYVAYLMLKSDMEAVWLRYPLAVGISYLAFLLMLVSWVRRRSDDGIANPEVGRRLHGEASAELDEMLSEPPLSFDDRTVQINTIDGFDAEALAFVVVASMVLLGATWAAVSIVWQNPFLLIELLLAIACALGLYHRVCDVEGGHHLDIAMRRTLWPAIAIVLLFAVLGVVLGWYAPEVRGFGELWRAAVAASHT